MEKGLKLMGKNNPHFKNQQGGWYGKTLLVVLFLLAIIVGFLVFQTYIMLTTDEKQIYTSPVTKSVPIPENKDEVNILPYVEDNSSNKAKEQTMEETSVPDKQVEETPVMAENENLHTATPTQKIEKLNPEQEMYAPPVQNVETTKAPIDPTNRSFDQEVDNLF